MQNEEINILLKDNNKEKEQLKQRINKLEEAIEKINEKDNYTFNSHNINYTTYPENLVFKDIIIDNHSSGSDLCNFEVFIGLKDKIEYIIYNNYSNYNIEIMRIRDKKIIRSLKGHNDRTKVIRYYMKDNKEECILTCDYKNIVIIWDIQNNFNIKYNIEYSGDIYDAILLFNKFKKDYILLSSCDKEYSKLYEFKDNTPFIKNIFETNKNHTLYMIPWLYTYKYYIIEFCHYKISINNIFEEETYANLGTEGFHYCGYIYNDNYLCTCDYFNNKIIIRDLVKKIIYKKIIYDAEYGRGIIGWNNIYAIVGCYGYIVIINIEGEKVKKIEIDSYIGGVKKMRISNKEYLILSGSNGKIIRYSI